MPGVVENSARGLLDQDMCALFPVNRTNGLFDKYRKVVLSSEALGEEFSMTHDGGKEMWLRQRVTKLGDSVAITRAMQPRSRPARNATEPVELQQLCV